MIAGGLTVLMIVLAGLMLWLKDKAKKGKHIFALTILIVGSGTTVTQIPWLGPIIDSVSTSVRGAGGIAGLIVLGGTLALVLIWIAAALPDRMVGYDPPDWLAYCGLLIPSLVSSLPGPLGRGMADLMTSLGGVGVDIGQALLGG
jgi:hypothetical protein